MTAATIAAAGDVVERIGSYAGYASIVGLGVLALLYFSQAREVRRLREWAGRAPERDAEVGARVTADAQRRVVAQPLAPSSTAAQQAAQQRAAATAAVYASVGAQPPGAPPPPGQLARPATAPGAPAAGAPAAGAPAPGAVPAPPAAPGAPAPAPPPTGAPPTGAPAPGTVPAATPAPAASTGTQTPAVSPAPAPGARPVVTATPTATPTPPVPPPAATAAARVAAQSRPVGAPPHGSASQDTTESAAARPGPLPYMPATGPVEEEDEGRFGMSGGRVAAIVGGAVTVIVVAVLVVVLTRGGETPPPPNDFGNAPSAQEPADTPGAADEPASSGSGASSSSALTSAERRATNVAVLNGTTQTGLARSVGDEIQKEGFKIGGVATNADQSVPTTIIAFTPGNERAAREVAKIIGVDSGSVQAADANTIVAAEADVVVTVGADKLG